MSTENNATTVQFQDKDTVIHKMNPITKLCAVAWICVFTLTMPGVILQFIAFGAMVYVSKMAQCQDKIISLCKIILIPLFIFVFLIQAFVNPENATIIMDFHLFGLHWQMGSEGAMIAIKLVSKLAVILVTVFVFTLSTKPELLMAALTQRKVSPHISYMFLATLNIVPQMRQRLETVRVAQEARGVVTSGNLLTRLKALLPMLMPLILTSLMDISERATTLEVRSFGVVYTPTSMYDIDETSTDRRNQWALLITMVLMIIIALF